MEDRIYDLEIKKKEVKIQYEEPVEIIKNVPDSQLRQKMIDLVTTVQS